MQEVINRILEDYRKADERMKAFKQNEHGYSFNQGLKASLKTVLFDMKELKIIDKNNISL